MGRYATPTVVKEMKGTIRPCRVNKDEPRPSTPLSADPPDYLSRDEKKLWRELLRMVVPGQLTDQDLWLAELSCQLMAKVRRREAMSGAELGRLINCLAHMGLTPAARSKVSVAPQKQEDDDLDFVSKH